MEYILLIKQYRLLKNMTQVELARKAKVRQSYISDLENNVDAKSPTLRTIFRIADALDICPYVLIQCDISCSDNCLKHCKKFF